MRARVHFVNRFFHPDHSATSQILTGVAFDLAARGHDVHVTTSRQLYENARADLERESQVSGVKVHRAASTRFGRSGVVGRAIDYFTFYLGAGWTLWRNVRPGDVVIAKTDPPLLSLVAAPVAWLRGARYVNWMQDVFPEVATSLGFGGLAARMVFQPLRALRNWSLRTADRNVVIGQRMADHLVGQSAPKRSIAIIPNWADPASVAPVPREENALRRDWGLEDKFVVGYCGNLGRVHDVATFIDAIAEVERRLAESPDLARIAFLFIGGGAKRREIAQSAEVRGLTSIMFKPYQPQERLSEALAVADVHLVSLLPEIEGLVVPSKVYGTMAVARPTLFVGDPDGEVAQLAARHECGLSVGIGEGARLADAILALATDPARCEAMGAAARAAFLAFYTRQFASLSWHTMLSGLTAESPAPATSVPIIPEGGISANSANRTRE